MKDLQKDSLSVELENNSNNIINPANTNDITIDVNWDDLPDTPYGTIGNIPFHDTTGKIDVNGGGQLQYTLPIALPPGIKSVAPQISLVYTSGSGNGIAGYGWNISGITSISRMGKTIEKDGEVKGVQLDYSDFYQFGGQRLILKSGEYGKDGAEYTTEKYSNVKIKSIGVNEEGTGPSHFEVTFEDGSQAWFGQAAPASDSSARTPAEYNIAKWKDAQGNYISYNYIQYNNVACIYRIEWGGNETAGTSHFNNIAFNYITRDAKEASYVNGKQFIQNYILTGIEVHTNETLFKKYVINYANHGKTKYQFVESVQEFNSKNVGANPVIFNYEEDPKIGGMRYNNSRYDNIFIGGKIISGDFDGDGKLDFINGNTLMLSRLENDTEFYNVSFEGDILCAGTDLKNGELVAQQAVFTGEVTNNSKTVVIRSYLFSKEIRNLELINTYSFDISSYVFKDGPETMFDAIYPDYPPFTLYRSGSERRVGTTQEANFKGTNLSDFCIEIYNRQTYTYSDNIEGYVERYYSVDEKRFYLNLQQGILKETSIKPEIIADFTGDGKSDILTVENNNLIVYGLNNENQFTRLFSTPKESLDNVLYLGDFNGNGKADIMAPLADGSKDWIMYMSTGNGFVKHYYSNFHLYQPRWQGKPRRYTRITRSYFTPDLNKDGKSDFLAFESEIWFRDEWYKWNDQDSTYGFVYYRNDGVDAVGKPIFSVADYINRIDLDKKGEEINYSMYGENYIPLVGSFRIAQANTEFSIIHKTKLITWDFGNKLNVISRIKEIKQGAIATNIKYAPATKDNNFYLSDSPVQYPYATIKENYNQYMVSQLNQEGRKQDFKYRNLVSHLQGKGMVGFRKSARSSWYANGYENTKIWSAMEMDPFNEGLPVKEWSIRTVNNDNLIFPQDLSVNNTQLLSFKSTDYDITTPSAGVKAIVPKKTIARDFLKDITEESSVIYGDYYLPKETTIRINNDFGVSTTVLDYTHNPNGTGKDYFIGRPQSKTETVTAYGDTQSAKEEYIYENNLLKTLKTFNQDNSGWVQEKYDYDSFGNITEKTISNSVDTMVQNQKSKYEPKGRFVEKKTDNLGLETTIEYNDWGQIKLQTDPLGNVLTNTYDGWGKLETSKTNLGGMTTYTYEKLSNRGSKVTEYFPDGNSKQTTANKLGQQIQVRTNAYNGRGTNPSSGTPYYIFVNTEYDILGRKIKETEPYYESFPVKWNTIGYDDSVFPAIITATAFNGKAMRTTVSGRTTSVEELKGYERITRKTTDALGNVISSEDKGGVINFSYNAAGKQIKAQYGSNVVTTEYDVWGRKSEFHDPSNGLYQYEYNGFGQIKKEISPNGYKEYSYNTKGQLTNRIEKSNTVGLTDKSTNFSYNDKGLLTSKSGASNGKNYSSTITYDAYGRVTGNTENSNGRTYSEKNILYDNKSRVVSYEKSLSSSGISTATQIENIYNVWNGQLFQVNDKTTGKVLWMLDQLTAKGQVVEATLGECRFDSDYDENDSLLYLRHRSPGGRILEMDYVFDPLKNELKERTRQGNFALSEVFTYDDNNRLVQWTNPTTGGISSNKYDLQGRITENDQIGSIQFGNSVKVYQPTGAKLNSIGKQNYLNAKIQRIIYNENNDPLYIQSKKGDVRFEYGLTGARQVVMLGQDLSTENSQPTTIKYYSEDGSFEVVRNNTTGEEKHILYIGGTPYESNIVYLKDFTQSSGSYKFLHKDYLGSILAISDDQGNLVQETHFDAWGRLTAGSVDLLGRGYTSHEHFEEIGIIHMNGRLYDPLLRRFLNADENIQDPYNTQIYNKYGYVINNPLMYNDPTGEMIWWLPLAIAVFSHAASSYYMNQPMDFGGLIQSLSMAIMSAGISYGIGEIFKAGGSIIQALGTVGTEIARGIAHGISGGMMSLMNGGNFGSGFLSGAFASAVTSSLGVSEDSLFDFNPIRSNVGKILTGAISGGIGSVLGGGNFWMGAAQGAIVVAFNHLGRHISTPKWDLNGDGKLSLNEANYWYRNGNGKAITVDASKVDLNFVDPSSLSSEEFTSVQTLTKSKDGRVYGQINLKLVGDGSNKVIIARDEYNFEMHGLKPTFRNAATIVGGVYAGIGKSFYINFSGYGVVGNGISSYIQPFINVGNYIKKRASLSNIIFR
ncbi:RHS repeat-associated core domain-containing protein [Elizabethkingia meningoseptica]|uniref:RHS repeat-associated core domain-containing protein n=1 Tax=Elizabethkingia meningoseptica TaxID=238 RepID=UPI00201258DC|nr:RHS repeat-associated core domain-containing protein [Elizabethkingia meningoseptica]MCL1676504.1 FG-GAP-like repeat-containing protein [Elizabethkingia meningoseptica]MCL1687432.1 FG-GAP-like repeat-containing protein [Elizabethkingia meningoseptica]